MSDMDYEMAWKRLKEKMFDRSLIYINLIASPIADDVSKRKDKISLSTVEMILDEMNLIEKEMTTVRDDDGQKVQD